MCEAQTCALGLCQDGKNMSLKLTKKSFGRRNQIEFDLNGPNEE
jgi:hypothetical protein